VRLPSSYSTNTHQAGGYADCTTLSSCLEVSRIPGEFDIRQACAIIISSLYHDLITAYGQRGFKPCTGSECDVVILVDTVPAHPDSSYQLSVFVQRDAAGKDLGAILEGRNTTAGAS
jgi:hypothetical protein